MALNQADAMNKCFLQLIGNIDRAINMRNKALSKQPMKKADDAGRTVIVLMGFNRGDSGTGRSDGIATSRFLAI